VSAVCHGPAAIGFNLNWFLENKNISSSFVLVNVKDQNGQSIFSGRKATSFSNEEEEQVKLTDAVPFLVETRLKELGAKYEKNDKPWGPHVTVDGQRLFFLLIFWFITFDFIF
jgi:putative intracellular protease/amidase